MSPAHLLLLALLPGAPAAPSPLYSSRARLAARCSTGAPQLLISQGIMCARPRAALLLWGPRTRLSSLQAVEQAVERSQRYTAAITGVCPVQRNAGPRAQAQKLCC
jgi:hypothetical protein